MSFRHTFTASILMVLCAVFLNYINHPEDIQPNKPFSTFPKKIGEWTGKEERFDEKINDILGVDDYILGNYYSTNGKRINLYVGFYQSQREGDLIHSPKHCLPGAGWNIIENTIEELNISESGSRKMKLIKLIIRKGDRKQIVLYWFQSRGRIISSEYTQKIYLVIDSVLKHRTDGSFVRLMAPLEDGDEAAALGRLNDFTRLLLPILNEYIPS